MRARAFFGEVHRQKMRHDKEESRFHESGSGSEHFSVRRIRLTAKKCGTTKKRVDSTKVEAALEGT
jgi:hypothetical protein